MTPAAAGPNPARPNSVPPDSVHALIADRAASAPDRPYLEDARSDRRIDYGRLAALTRRWSEVFEQLSLPPSSAVLVDSADPLGFAVVHLAAIAHGLRSLPVDPSAPDEETTRLAGLIRGAGLVVATGAPTRRPRGVGSASIGEDLGPVQLRPGVVPEPAEPAGEGSAVLFTSGSTGSPKGVELGEGQLLCVAREAASALALKPGERGFNSLPLHHVNAQVVGLLATLAAGSTLVLDSRFRRTGFWELLAERGITWLNAVPAILAVLTRSGPIRPPASLRLIRCASAPLPEHVGEALAEVPLVMSWGMTEGASQITATAPGRHRMGEVGHPRRSEVRAVGPDSRPAAPGEIAALQIRGPGVISHYLFGAAADRFAEGGWLVTGDIGSIAADGAVSLVGRADDVINRGGEKVYPGEVEEVLLGDDRVLEAVVVGRPDEVLGAVPVAYVIPVAELSPRERDALLGALYERSDAQLARSRRPIEITVVDDLPRAAAGKVQRSRVRERESSRGGAG